VTETDIEAHSVQQILATFHSFIHSFILFHRTEVT